MKLKRINFDVVKSSNHEAIKLIKQNKNKPSIVVTKKQTHGKGTMGKKWVSITGNIFFSIFFNLNSIKSNPMFFSRLNPRLIKKILQKYTKKKIIVKKPNDLLIDKKKICGILQEVIEFNHKKYLIIGIGINTFFSPKNKNFSSINLQEIKKKKIKNSIIINEIKKNYENLLFDMKKYDSSNFQNEKKNIYK